MRIKFLERMPGYQFHENGSIIGRRLRPLTGDIVNGYRKVLILGKRYYAHRLICEAFNGPAPSLSHQTAHIDGNRLNNSALNLRWATPKENEADKIAHGTQMCGEKNHFTNLTDVDVRDMRDDRVLGDSFRELADRYGVSKSTAFNVCKGITWRTVE